MTTFTSWLRQLEPTHGHALLLHRPDAASLDDLDELAAVLESPGSVRLLADRLTLPQLQVLEALLGLGRRATVASVTELLAAAVADHDQHVRTVLDELYERGVAWPDGDSDNGGVRVVEGVTALFPQPLGADGTLSTLLAAVSVTELRHLLAAHGQAQAVDPKPQLEAALMTTLSDPLWVRAAVTATDAEICEPILALAKGPNEDADPADYADERGFDYDTGYLGQGWGRRPTRREIFRQHPMALGWALEHGLVLPAPRGGRYGYSHDDDVRMAVEVSLALRGSAYRAPFAPTRPEAVVAAVDVDAVAAAAAVAAGDFAQQALAVLDMVARCPWPLTKSGGLGLRELDRLARAAVVGPGTARLVLELADNAGLLQQQRALLHPSPQFDAWRASSPADRYAALVAAWWHLPFAPTSVAGGNRSSLRPLERRPLCDPPDRARESLLAAMASLPVGEATELSVLESLARWQRPRLQAYSGDSSSRTEDGWAVAWTEAETLGVLALGTLTAVGRALHHATTAADLVPVVAALVPADTDRVAVGSDLTAVAIGAPTDRLRLLLDRMADRDSSGTVVSWRFSAASVRRALDDGAEAASLLSHLEQVTGTELPQTLRYLFHDVARRHGELRLSGHGTLIRGLDESRVAEALHDRSLEQLGLRRLAPTILSCRSSLDEAIQALRRAGYYPIPEGTPAEWLEVTELRTSA